MDTYYWKKGYQHTWAESSRREHQLAAFIQEQTGLTVSEYGLGAGSDRFITGSAQQNGHEKGEADLLVEGTNIFIEVTAPSQLLFQSARLFGLGQINCKILFATYQIITILFQLITHLLPIYGELFTLTRVSPNATVRTNLELLHPIFAEDENAIMKSQHQIHASPLSNL